MADDAPVYDAAPDPASGSPASVPFSLCHLAEVALEETCAHGGEGLIHFARLADRSSLSGLCNFIDLAVLPPGTSIGRHAHQPTEEEFYLVLDGAGTMYREGEEFPVRAGDLVRNPPGGRHGLRNTGDAHLRIFVFEIEVP